MINIFSSGGIQKKSGVTASRELIERHLALVEARVRVGRRFLSFHRLCTYIISHLIAPDSCEIVRYVINNGDTV